MNKRAWARYSMALLLVVVTLSFFDRFFTVEGESGEPKVVLMRLEDVGPGGQYDTPEQLGKLRCVLEYLGEQHVRYQIGVIPRWLDFLPDMTVYDQSLDRQDIPYIRSFTSVLKNAEQNGAVIGMHGYTHQVGQTRRSDGHQESGIGNEFDVAGLPETSQPAYAKERLEAGLQILKAADISPKFWEAPHYHSAVGQDDMFRSFFGIIYENDKSKPNQQTAFYKNVRNTGLSTQTLGAAYVPTPFSFIPYNRDEKLILNQTGKGKRLASFFYHPFLEFKHLQPVLDREGNPVLRDGLPEFTYPVKAKSILQKLIGSVREEGFSFYSLQDYVPFTPAQSVRFRNDKESLVRLGDADGDGQCDIVVRDFQNGTFNVTSGSYRGSRNEQPQAAKAWLNVAFNKGDQVALFDYNQDGKSDLWLLRATGQVEAYRSTGDSFVIDHTWKTAGPIDWLDVYPLRQADGSWVVTGVSKAKSELQGLYLSKGELKATAPLKIRSVSDKKWLISKAGGPGTSEHLWMPKTASNSYIDFEFDPVALQWKVNREKLDVPEDDGELRLGDFNGDGKEDILFWNDSEKTAAIMERDDEGKYRVVSRFGPWGKDGARLVVKDFDGNGKSDLGLLGMTDGVLDIALSYQSEKDGL
ncbi:DUF2334 domain-containing protein [Paenibacillus sp. MBLB4367]|uniref:DUF2334 domain-containing protein n=1 Tax=Paenibacillus sp. MBLB4367 TaxID=3384767 RepID=UPI003908176C